MATVVGVRFREDGKIYDFDAGALVLKKGTMVVVETSRGPECGEVVTDPHNVSDEAPERPLRIVIRVANDRDLARREEQKNRAADAMRICQEKVAQHGLDMKLVDVEYSVEESKLLFYFTSEGRVDFRALVKDLAATFHMRIELRQIGVRDEAKMIGGYGLCGRALCCAQFLPDFVPVSIKMAKTQSLSLNPTKISGSCGRLMCCLKYEQDVYEELLKMTPKVGAIVMTEEGRGMVVDTDLLRGTVKVRLDKTPEAPPLSVSVTDLTVIREGRGKIPKEPVE